MLLTNLLRSLSHASWRAGTVPRERWHVERTEDGGLRISLTLRPGEVADDRPKLHATAGLGASTPAAHVSGP